MSAGRFRRCDGAHLSHQDLTECVPIHPTELEELVWPIDLVEDWLLHTSHATLDDLARFINDDTFGPSRPMSPNTSGGPRSCCTG